MARICRLMSAAVTRRLATDRDRAERDFALYAAVALDSSDTLHNQEFALDNVVDVPGELFERHAWRDRGIGENGLPFDIDALDNGLVDRAR